MQSIIGLRLGHYDIVGKLGEGGMGEVYRAHDVRLKRDVALKMLPDSFASDPERLARFEREAQVLASLNHPHIAAIYGVEEATEGDRTVRALILELVEGETLGDKIARGALPVDEALPIAAQVAAALEAAHDKGIVHRDLKPSNVACTPDHQAKVLDFGLAKALGPQEGGPYVRDAGGLSPASMSPTFTVYGTSAGVILGTAAYMSPEQARGRSTDRRADIWAFGCLLYEMLTGRQTFDPGESVSDAIASILRAEPDWNALPPETPLSIRTLLRRCLEKDPQKRLPHIGVARIEIEEAAATLQRGEVAVPPAAPIHVAQRASTRRTAAVAAGALALGIVVTAVAVRFIAARSDVLPAPVRFGVLMPSARAFTRNAFYSNVAISPDGRYIAYVANSTRGEVVAGQLMVRSLDRLTSVGMPGITEIAAPFFSPDGQWIGFFSAGGTGSGQVRKVSVNGGSPITICQYQGNTRGGTWTDDDRIVFATSDTTTGLLSVSAGGGDPVVLTRVDPAKGERDHLFPSALPGGHAVLFTVAPLSSAESAQIALLDLDTKQQTMLIRGGGQPALVDDRYIVYGSSGGLRAVGFDPGRRRVTTNPVPVLEGVRTMTTAAASFSIARNGTLIYVPGQADTSPSRPVLWVDREGREQPLDVPPRPYAFVRLSPDGTKLAFDIRDQDNDIWIWSLARRTLTRLTFEAGADQTPLWTPDGQRVVFTSLRNGGVPRIFWQPSDGSAAAQQLTTAPYTSPQSISSDGKTLVIVTANGDNGSDLVASGLNGGSMTPIASSRFAETNGELSPDGRWLAYQSNESGRNEVYVIPFANAASGGRWQISTGGGSRPAWTRNGHEIVYLSQGGIMMAVTVETAPTFTAGVPVKLFQGQWFTGLTQRSYDVTPDGQRFLMIRDAAVADDPDVPPIAVVLNWKTELTQRMSRN